jgi:hypothetical protein
MRGSQVMENMKRASMSFGLLRTVELNVLMRLNTLQLVCIVGAQVGSTVRFEAF